MLGQRLQKQRQRDRADGSSRTTAKVLISASCRPWTCAWSRPGQISRRALGGADHKARHERPLRVHPAVVGVDHRGGRIESASRRSRPAGSPARSDLVRTRRSATATCSTRFSCVQSAGAGHRVDGGDDAAQHHRPATPRRSSASAGSAPGRRARWSRSPRARMPGPRLVPPRSISSSGAEVAAHLAAQATGLSSMKLSSLASISSWSRPISPNSLMITAVREHSAGAAGGPSRVVLPLPRKPVSTRTGITTAPAGSRPRGPGPCSYVAGVERGAHLAQHRRQRDGAAPAAGDGNHPAERQVRAAAGSTPNIDAVASVIADRAVTCPVHLAGQPPCLEALHEEIA